MKYKEALGVAARDAGMAIMRTGEPWVSLARHLIDAGYEAFTIIIRLAVFLTFPISVPILAWLIVKDEALRKKQLKAFQEEFWKRHSRL